MYSFIYLILFTTLLFSAQIRESIWRDKETFSNYLKRYHIPLDLLRSISPEDSKYLSEIHGGEKLYELIEDGKLISALIPLGEEMQIQLTRDLESGKYSFDITPVVYKEVNDTVVVDINRSCYKDIASLTNNGNLASILEHLYKNSVDFRKLRQGDRVAFIYHQKSRIGRPWGQAELMGAVVKSRGKNRFIFIDEDGNAWEDIQKEIKKVIKNKRVIEYKIEKKIRIKSKINRFIKPLKGARVSSKFSYKRWHPILHKYRPHLGIDWAIRRGAPVYAVDDGKVIYSGWIRGYGKSIKIKHKGGFISLYAHQSRLKVKRGEYVKRGEVIGAVGSTGISTGPHLHFGLYLRGRAVNPLKYIGKVKTVDYKIKIIKTKKKKVKFYTKIYTKKVEIKGAKSLKKRLLHLLSEPKAKAYKWRDISKNFVYIDDIKI